MMTRSIHECWHVRTNKCVQTNICKTSVFVVSVQIYSDGSFRKDYGNRNRKQLVPAVVSFAKQETETGNTRGSGRPTRPPEAKWRRKKNNSDVVVHRRACLLEFWTKFSGVSLAQKTSFQTQKCWWFDTFTFWESNILTNVCVMNVMMSVVCARRTDRWVTGCEDKSFHRFTSTLYSSSFSSLSSALVSIPNLDCLLATSE